MMSRGLKNNNPGNIRTDKCKWLGEVQPSQDREFKQFENKAWGYRAMFHLINNYSRLYGCDTIRKIITRWAPSSENNTEAYITAVCGDSRIPADMVITTTNKDVMIPIIAAMSRVENGVPAVMPEVGTGWELFIQNKK